MIVFSKYQGCGNDFIIVDDRQESFPHSIIPQLCHRHKGIGADGLILLKNSKQADFQMVYFNADGNEAEMCGNGIRCLTRFLKDQNLIDNEVSIEIFNTVLSASIIGDEITVEMGKPHDFRWSIPYGEFTLHHINTGVPHVVIFCDQAINLSSIGSKIRHDPTFAPNGVNVNIANIQEDNIFLRTYERGVEAETQACGTGACATAIAAAKVYHLQPPLYIRTKSQDILTVDFKFKNEIIKNLKMTGPARFIFEGKIKNELNLTLGI